MGGCLVAVQITTRKEQLTQLFPRDIYNIIKVYLAENQWQFRGDRLVTTSNAIFIIVKNKVIHRSTSGCSVAILAHALAKLLGQDRWVRKHEILREMHYCTEAHQIVKRHYQQF